MAYWLRLVVLQWTLRVDGQVVLIPAGGDDGRSQEGQGGFKKLDRLFSLKLIPNLLINKSDVAGSGYATPDARPGACHC